MTRRLETAGQRGYSFVELLIVTSILFVLASAVMPLRLAKFSPMSLPSLEPSTTAV